MHKPTKKKKVQIRFMSSVKSFKQIDKKKVWGKKAFQKSIVLLGAISKISQELCEYLYIAQSLPHYFGLRFISNSNFSQRWI